MILWTYKILTKKKVCHENLTVAMGKVIITCKDPDATYSTDDDQVKRMNMARGISTFQGSI